MPEDQSGLYQAGETLLLVKVPEAEPLVGGWRRRFDSSAGARLPAHVTVLYPFLDHGRIDADVLGALELLVGAHGAFDIRFECFGRFPDVLFLVPTPGGPLRALTQAVCERWPEVPPYGGRFVEVVPHLTVAHGQERSVFDEAEAALTGRLPVTARVSAVQLLVCDGESWHEQAAFPCSVEVNHVDEVVAAGEVAVPKVAIRQKGYLELDCSGRAVGIAEPLIPPSKVRPQGGRRRERIMGPARGGLPPRTDATRPRAGLRHLPGQHRDAGQQHPASVVGSISRRAYPRASIRDGFSTDGGSRQHGADDLTRAHESLMPPAFQAKLGVSG